MLLLTAAAPNEDAVELVGCRRAPAYPTVSVRAHQSVTMIHHLITPAHPCSNVQKDANGPYNYNAQNTHNQALHQEYINWCTVAALLCWTVPAPLAATEGFPELLGCRRAPTCRNCHTPWNSTIHLCSPAACNLIIFLHSTRKNSEHMIKDLRTPCCQECCCWQLLHQMKMQ